MVLVYSSLIWYQAPRISRKAEWQKKPPVSKPNPIPYYVCVFDHEIMITLYQQYIILRTRRFNATSETFKYGKYTNMLNFVVCVLGIFPRTKTQSASYQCHLSVDIKPEKQQSQGIFLVRVRVCRLKQLKKIRNIISVASRMAAQLN